ncbi:lipoyl amidotransferase LIPT1, mitochondrial-like [Rhynchophorus ferrugineus]|uniref:lipoyl amidotransferase LIPT1, mitochondrial-like n=1 Tax=Rhynchophorus ferrugineus TaxID=354439 RepID=UPI003FCD5DDB
MAQFQRSFFRTTSMVTRLNTRCYSKTDYANEKNIKKSVFISQSKDVYTNLALQQWLFKNFDFTNHHVLMLWQNDPSVVIGMEQNPWLETNYSELNNLGVQLARRSSNGEAFYEDNGTLNLSFFSSKERYNSRYNMEIISRGIFREFGCKTDLNSADDLLLRNNKQFSGKSAKIGQSNSYHYCSIMVRVNKINENLLLQPHGVDIQSVKNRDIKKMNLCEENPQVSVDSAMQAIGWEFLRTKALSLKDGGLNQANQQRGFHLINPTEGWFPGITEIRDNYASWQWCYGKTPVFDITQTFTVPGDLIDQKTGSSAQLKVTMTVEKGKISDITLFVPYGFTALGFTGEAKVIHNLKGKKFSIEAFNDLEDSLGVLLDDRDKFVTECLKQVMTCA